MLWRFRVATERTVFAMPETALGLHPDVGASYFLTRLPGHFAEYVGLTGDRLDGADLLHCGLATHFVPSQRLPWLEERLGGLERADAEVVSTAIDEFCDAVFVGQQGPWQLVRREAIEWCFSRGSVEEILAALEGEAQARSGDEWLQSTIGKLRKASPTSLKVTLRSIRERRRQALHQCLAKEFRLSSRFMERKLSNDFYEGCGAILVDKDNAPKWDPTRVEDVSEDSVNAFFLPMEKELELPVEEREPQFVAGQRKSRL